MECLLHLIVAIIGMKLLLAIVIIFIVFISWSIYFEIKECFTTDKERESKRLQSQKDYDDLCERESDNLR
jgi:hypothetical protein